MFYKIQSLIFLILLLSLSIGTKAGETKKYSGGQGTESNPYIIKTEEDLIQLSRTSDDWSSCFIQKADIIATNSSDTIISIGQSYDNYFEGVYDGNNYRVKGFKIKGRDNNDFGLFGSVSNATLKNIRLEDNLLLRNYDVGFLVGTVFNSNITNCYVKGNLHQLKGSFGGLIISCHNSQIDNCRSEIVIEKLGQTFSVGGLISRASNYSQVTNCSAALIIENKQVDEVETIGGLIGCNKESDVVNCKSEGRIIGKLKVGGLIGENICREYGAVKNCFSSVDVKGNKDIGGLIGKNEGYVLDNQAEGTAEGIYVVEKDEKSESSNIGGLIGSHEDGLVKRCSAIGAVSGNDNVGGLIGNAYRGDVSDCYAAGFVFGEAYVGGLIGNSYHLNQIYHSIALGRVVGVLKVGGFLGGSSGSGYINQCCCESFVIGQSSVGGFVGEIRSVVFNDCYATGNVFGLFDGDQIHYSSSGNVGGFAGNLSNVVLNRCYAQTNIRGKTKLGAFAGGGSSNAVSNCFASGEIISFDSSGCFAPTDDFGKMYNYSPELAPVNKNRGWGYGGKKEEVLTNQSTKVVPVPSEEEYFSSENFTPFNFQNQANQNWWFSSKVKPGLKSKPVIVFNKSLIEKPVLDMHFSVADSDIEIVEAGYRYRDCKNDTWLSKSFSSVNNLPTMDFPLSIDRDDYYIQSYVKDSEGNMYYGNMLCTRYSNLNQSVGEAAQTNKSYTLTDKDVIVYEGVIEKCFYDYQNTDIIIPEWLDKQYVTAIDSRVFSNKGITSVIFPESIKSIGREAFAKNKLTHVTIPVNGVSILPGAFIYNEISILEFPDSSVQIDKFAFFGNKIKSLQYPKYAKISDLAFGSNEITSINGEKTNGLIFRKDSLGTEDRTVIVGYWGPSCDINFLPSTIDSISHDVFSQQEITSVVLPEGLKYIGGFSFGENKISNLKIPSSVEVIERYAFKDNNIVELEFNEGLKYIGNEAFQNNKISKLDLKEGVEFIGDEAFQDNNITHLDLPNSLEVISEQAFLRNSISSVILPGKLRKLSVDAFHGNPISYLNLPKSTNSDFVEWRNQDDEIITDQIKVQDTWDSYYAWYKDTLDLEDIAFKNGVLEELLDYKKYHYLIIPNSFNGQTVTCIGEEAFRDSKIYTIQLPDSLRRIEKRAFKGMNNLKEIHIPPSVTFIGEEAFYYSGIESFALPQSADSNFMGWYLQKISGSYSSADTEFVAYENELVTELDHGPFVAQFKKTAQADDFVVENGVIVKYTGQAKTVKIPFEIKGQKITEVGKEAFANMELTEVYIPQNIEKIGADAFYNNVLNSVEFDPQSMLSFIGRGAFSGNPELTEIVLPDSGFQDFKDWKSINNHFFKEGDTITNLYLQYQVELK